MLSRSARGQRDRARPAKSDIMVNVFFVFLFFSVGHNLVRWAKPKLTDSAHHWMNLACGLIYFFIFIFFTGAISCSSAHRNPKEVFAVRQPALFPYVALRFRTSGMIWSGRLKKKTAQKVPLWNMFTKNNWGGVGGQACVSCFASVCLTSHAAVWFCQWIYTEVVARKVLLRYFLPPEKKKNNLWIRVRWLLSLNYS